MTTMGLIRSRQRAVTLPQPSYEEEATAFFNAAGDFILAERYHYNRWFKRIKDNNLLAKVTACWVRGPWGRYYDLVDPGSWSDTQPANTTSGMSATEQHLFDCITLWLERAIQYGMPEIYDPGTGPAEVTADVVVYGLTPGGITAAYEAVRQGRSAVLVGGWRERNLGGMLAGGLGATDWFGFAALGGLGEWILDEIEKYGGVQSNRVFEPKYAEAVFRQMLDPRKRAGRRIPVYLSEGIDAVTKEAARITQFTTVDGRTFTGSMFVDGSYEGDLMARSGVTYRIGREAQGSGSETTNGYRPLYEYNFDPYVTPGVQASGYIHPLRGLDARANGAADVATYKDRVQLSATSGVEPMTQAYNFRMTMTDDPVRIAALPTTPSADFDIAKHEALLRWIKMSTDDAVTVEFITEGLGSPIISIQDPLGAGANDVNSTSKFSSDNFGQNWAYAEASYEDRETIWRDHQRHIEGIYYVCQHYADARVTATIRDEALTWGLVNDHYLDPHPNDSLHWPYQLYVREGRRMVGSLVWDANDIEIQTGTPRSTKTVAVASYAMDSHVVGAIARDDSGTMKVYLDGPFFDTDVNWEAPLPYEIITPQEAECENLFVTFCISATHSANGAIRMEFSSILMGQAAGAAAAIAIENDVSVQDVNYTTLRARLFASNTNQGEPDPVLPQVN